MTCNLFYCFLASSLSMVDGMLSIINVFTPSIQNYAIKNCSQLPSTLTRKDGQQFMGTQLISIFTLPSDTEVGLPAHSVDFHFRYIFDLNLEIFILQHFSSSLPNVAMIYLNCSTCKKISSSDLHSSLKVGINLHLCLQAEIGIFKPSRKPQGLCSSSFKPSITGLKQTTA